MGAGPIEIHISAAAPNTKLTLRRISNGRIPGVFLKPEVKITIFTIAFVNLLVINALLLGLAFAAGQRCSWGHVAEW